jgi:phage terminase large subunit-like protein
MSQAEQDHVLREWALCDLYFFAKYILGYWWLCWEPHKEFADEIQADVNMSLFLLPRGHCKTFLFNTGSTIQNYLKQPDEQIAIFCDTSKRAKWKLRAIKQQFEQNKLLYSLWPDLIWKNPVKETKARGMKWTDEELFLPGHNGLGQEPSIGVYGLDSQPTSLHFKRVKGDDLVTPETVTTDDQIKKNKALYGLVRSSILSPGGNIQICGTIYDDGDLHREMEDSGEYRIYKRPAEWVDEETGSQRQLWPVQYPQSHLDKIKRDPSVGVYIYSCQYLLDPAPENDDSFFNLNWFPEYDRVPLRRRVYAAADLAISEKETACDTAIVVGALDENNELYIMHVRYGRWDSLKIIDNLIAVQGEYGPETFDIEAENIAKTIMPFLRLKMRETGIWLNIPDGGTTPKGDKVSRARPFQGRSREGAIHLPKRGQNEPKWLFDARHQIQRFPRGRKKDIVDSIGLLCHRLAGMWAPKAQEQGRVRAEEYTDLYV